MKLLGIALVILGTLVFAAAAALGWLSWMEPHSEGIHRGDRAPVLIGAGSGIALAGFGLRLLLGAPGE